jgi:hypothetical protein
MSRRVSEVAVETSETFYSLLKAIDWGGEFRLWFVTNE